MSRDDFIAALKKSQSDAKPLPGLDVLLEFCSAIKEFVGGPVDCEPVPTGTVATFGQEYKLVITYTPASYSSTLLRAYLNREASPYLDRYDGKGPQPCGNVDGLRTNLTDFLAIPGVSDMLESFRRDAEVRR